MDMFLMNNECVWPTLGAKQMLWQNFDSYYGALFHSAWSYRGGYDGDAPRIGDVYSRDRSQTA